MACCILAHSTICQSQAGIQPFCGELHLGVLHPIPSVRPFAMASDATFREFLSALSERGEREQFLSFWVQCSLVEHLPLPPSPNIRHRSWRWGPGYDASSALRRAVPDAQQAGVATSFPSWGRGAGRLFWCRPAWGERKQKHAIFRTGAAGRRGTAAGSIGHSPGAPEWARVLYSGRAQRPPGWRRGNHSYSVSVVACLAVEPAGLARPILRRAALETRLQVAQQPGPAQYANVAYLVSQSQRQPCPGCLRPMWGQGRVPLSGSAVARDTTCTESGAVKLL